MPARLADVLVRSLPAEHGFLVPYFMVDRAHLRTLGSLIEAARTSGADAVELGFPFTDPIADGPTLQAASARALKHRTRWDHLLEAVEAASALLPVAVMTYANPVYHRGLDTALAMLRSAGASGLIVPDLSLEESEPWRRACERAGVSLVLMAAPGTSAARLKALVRHTSGFLYLVSRYGVTGGTGFRATPELRSLMGGSHRTRPSLPVLIGFGVRAPEDASKVLRAGGDGVVVGSALEDRLARDYSPRTVSAFLRPVAAQLRRG